MVFYKRHMSYISVCKDKFIVFDAKNTNIISLPRNGSRIADSFGFPVYFFSFVLVIFQ